MTTETGSRTRRPDRHALAVAQAAANAISPAKVLLFGSRARGDHRPDSDINLLLVSQKANPEATAELARTAAKRFMQSSGEPQPRLSIHTMTQAEFQRRRQREGDIAHRAATEGIAIN